MNRLLRAGLLLSLALMAGRLAGFARELMLASRLGLSAEADVAIVLLTLPDLLVNLLLSGGLAVALVPALRGMAPSRAAALFGQASLWTGLLFAALGGLLLWAPGLWLSLLAPGSAVPALGLGLWALVAVALPLAALSGVSSAALNAGERFFVAGCGTLLFNLCVIAALALAHPGQEVLPWLCWGIAAGALLRWLSQLLALPGGATALWQAPRQAGLVDAALLRSFSAGLAAASLLILIPVLLRAAASWLAPGQLAAFNYAIKLVELPLGIVITTLATVAFPRMSEFHARGDREAFDALLSGQLQKAVLLSLVVLLCGLAFGEAVVALLFERGQVSAADAQVIALLTKIALLSLPFVGVATLLSAALNASQRPGTVLRLNLSVLLLLPLLAMPGLLARSGSLLMWALPAVHLGLAWLLAHQLGWGMLRPCRRILPASLSVMAIVGLIAAGKRTIIEAVLPPGAHLYGEPALALLAFVMASALGLRILDLNRRPNLDSAS